MKEGIIQLLSYVTITSNEARTTKVMNTSVVLGTGKLVDTIDRIGTKQVENNCSPVEGVSFESESLSFVKTRRA